MDSVLRAAVVYLVILVLFRLVGKRSLADVGPFDFVLLLIIAEATQQAMIDDDNSMTNSFLVILTLLTLNVGSVPGAVALVDGPEIAFRQIVYP